MRQEKPLILASSSPRRSQLLQQMGVSFEVIPSNIEEIFDLSEKPREVVARLAQEKAQHISILNPDRFVLAADTCVTLDNRQILGKPRDKQEAFSMLEQLQGKEHIVLTGFSLINISLNFYFTQVVQSRVKFNLLSKDFISAYIETGEPMDKAGAYGIQGFGASLISEIYGSYTNVVGLPLAELLEELQKIGLWSPGMMLNARDK